MNERPISSGWSVALATLACMAALASCGGGVDSGGTGAPVSLAAGPVSGLGSITVNGVRFDDDAAVISDQDSNPLTADQLQPGMVARIDASPISATSTGQQAGTAFDVRINSELIGPVDRIGPLGSTVVVLGQTVRITVATWFDSALATGTGSLAIGQVVEVWGQFNAGSNEYVATRIAPRGNATGYEIRGLLGAVDPVAKTLTVEGLKVSYGGVDAASLPPLTAGKFVRLSLAATMSGDTWTATAVSPGNIPLPDRPDVRIGGRVSALTSPTQFVLDGISVDASAASFPAGTSGITLGARVAVTGSTSAGVFHAATVNFVGDETLSNSTFEFHGGIATLNLAAGVLKVHGTMVYFGAQTTFVGGVPGDLAVGRSIDVVGTLDSNGTSIDAQKITFE